MNNKNQYIVDKTQHLQRGIEIFPSLYIEGAAASGKTVAVQCLLEKHPEIKSVIFEMKEIENTAKFRETLCDLKMQMENEAVWVVFEQLQNVADKMILKEMTRFAAQIPEKGRVIFVSRERPAEELLDLLWKRKMELISSEIFMFTEEEIQHLTEMRKSSLSASDIYAVSGGWAGCVDMMFRMAQQNSKEKTAEELRNSYEISTYIEKEILETLSSDEQEIVRRAAVCPWLNGELCREVWGITQAEMVMESLQRKGMLLYNREKKRWKLTPLFQNEKNAVSEKEWEYLGEWYETHGYTYETLLCLKRSSNISKYQECVWKHYHELPFLGWLYEEVMGWKNNSPQAVYLRGMQYYAHRDFDGLEREIKKLHPENGVFELEIFLNLTYVYPKMSLDEWLDLLERNTDGKDKIHLYYILGNAHTFLCGLRDLSGLFACSKKEEKRRERLWKEYLGEEEQLAYRLAKIDYYLETERKNQIDEELSLLENISEKDIWQIRLAGIYLLCKLQNIDPSEERLEKIQYLEQALLKEEHPICLQNVKAVDNLYAAGRKEIEKLTRWLRYTDTRIEVSEENYILLCCQAKGYMILNQYEKAERIIRRLIPYLQEYKRYRFLSEVLFQQAIVNWRNKNHSMALRNAIESFVVNGDCRYVTFYTGYGMQGIAVMEAYMEWYRKSWPERWKRKKKYNYGNVLRMPWVDYLEVVLRYMKRKERENPAAIEETIEERLTLMETIILQSIGRGLTNAEICEELNLKITTVKSHVYSLYKKLGVNSRAQAIVKGKEIGIIG